MMACGVGIKPAGRNIPKALVQLAIRFAAGFAKLLRQVEAESLPKDRGTTQKDSGQLQQNEHFAEDNQKIIQVTSPFPRLMATARSFYDIVTGRKSVGFCAG